MSVMIHNSTKEGAFFKNKRQGTKMKPNLKKLEIDKDSVFIIGKSVVLRIAKPEDAKMILENMDTKTVKKFSFFTKFPTLEEEKEFLAAMYESNSDLLFVIETKQGQFVGTIGLHEVEYGNETARIGIILFNPKTHGQGFAGQAIRLLLSYAFNELGLHKVYLNVFEANEKSRNIYRHIGFKEEGVLRAEYKLRGEYINLVRMAVLKEEWKMKKERG